MISADFPRGSWVHLKNRAIFRISGPDRVRYLNGQVTNDVAGPLDKRAIGACLCSLKGKVEFLVWISEMGDYLILDGQIDQREELAMRLDRYLIADDCEITDITDELLLVHHFDPTAGGVQSRRSNQEGYDLFMKAGDPPVTSGPEITPEDFAIQQALAVIPEYPTEITGNEFPAELGIDQWSVDFHKGCYLGQEVISRIKSVGKVKRSLILGRAETQLQQDSKVRTEAGAKGCVTRLIRANEEKISLALCLINEAPQSASRPVPQRVEAISD